MADKNNVYNDYDLIANWFDEHRSREFFEKPYLDRLILYLAPHAKILDLGCGMGQPIAQYCIEQGFEVVGVDGSLQLIARARQRFPQATWIVHDMRNINLNQKFDAIILWHSLFHLPVKDQSAMFSIFKEHLNDRGMLLFTTGHDVGEVWSNNGGQELYHASQSEKGYKQLLQEHGFKVLVHNVQDALCGEATVWMAQFYK